jgi:ABC-type sulfate transport system permease component
MADLVATFFTAFAGGVFGGWLGVWLAWRSVRGEVVRRVADNMRTTGL